MAINRTFHPNVSYHGETNFHQLPPGDFFYADAKFHSRFRGGGTALHQFQIKDDIKAARIEAARHT
jgi:hypothetical protein